MNRIFAMDTFLHTNRLHYLLAWTLLGLLLLLLVLEGWRYGVKPSEANNEQLIEQSLTEASNYFLSKQKTLLSNTEDLAATLQSPLLQERSSQYLHNTLTQFPQFWGIVLYQEKNPITWTGFALGDSRQPNPSTRKQEPTVSLKKHNNVIYWEFHVPFTVQDSSGMVNYDLLTSYRVEQRNPLPIGDRNEFTLFNSSDFTTPYPLNHYGADCSCNCCLLASVGASFFIPICFHIGYLPWVIYHLMFGAPPLTVSALPVPMPSLLLSPPSPPREKSIAITNK